MTRRSLLSLNTAPDTVKSIERQYGRKVRELCKNLVCPLKKPWLLLDRYDYILMTVPALNLTNTAVVVPQTWLFCQWHQTIFTAGIESDLDRNWSNRTGFRSNNEKKLICTKYDAREFTSLKYLAEIAEIHNDKRFSTAIRTCADVKNAITKKEDLFRLKKSNAKEDYDNFAQELMGLDKFKRTTKSIDN